MEETTPRTSAKWQPHSTFAAEIGLEEKAAQAPRPLTHDRNNIRVRPTGSGQNYEKGENKRTATKETIRWPLSRLTR
jgi:hypothetical protein